VRVLLDTSVLVAGLVRSHPHHEAADAWLRGVHRGHHQGFIAAHSLAETYAVLTRLPVRPRIASEEAWQLIQADLLTGFEHVTLDAGAYVEVLRLLSEHGIVGGAVYDALILRCASAVGAECLLTFNTADFARLAQVLGGEVASPYQRPA
jgi:predicted nucleic acid-binding protein